MSAGFPGELLLGVDIGTSSTKGVLVTVDGRILATAVRPHTVNVPRPGWAEMDAERTWWAEVGQVCRELVAAAGGAGVAAVCVSGVGPCLVLCDEAGTPVRPAILYGIDMRAGDQIRELGEQLGENEILRRGGTALSSQAVGPKLAWVREQEPEVWSRARRWYGCSSFVASRLTGEYVLDHHTASQCDPLYDLARCDWTHDWYQLVAGGLPAPRLVWPDEVVGVVTAEAAKATGLAVGTPVCAGTVDAWAEAFSVGAHQIGDLMLMYGSTMFMVRTVDQPYPHPLLWSTCGVAEGSYSLAAGMSTSGTLVSWVREVTGHAPYETLEAEAAAVPAGSDGLLLLPYFAGERTPVFDARARGVLAGLTLGHGRGHLLRAAYEGIAFGVRQIVSLLDEHAGPAKRVLAVGGGTRGRLWSQVVSDVTGREQIVSRESIGASYGSALLAAIGTGLADPAATWAEHLGTVVPDPVNREVYDTLFQAYLQLYPSTVDVVHVLARQQEAAAWNG